MFAFKRLFILIACATVMLLFHREAQAVYPVTALDEISQTADLIFVGTVSDLENVTSGSAASTIVTFSDIDTVHAGHNSRQKNQRTVKLVYAGGTIGDTIVSTSNAPHLELGHTYMIFMRDDGKNYINPIIGGPQGVFGVVKDKSTGQQFITTAGGHGVSEISPSARPVPTSGKLALVNNGVATYASPIDNAHKQQTAVAADGSKSAGIATAKSRSTAPPMTVQQFKNYVIKQALKSPVKSRQIQSGEGGKFYRMKDGKIVGEKHKLLDGLQSVPMPTKTPKSGKPQAGNAKDSVTVSYAQALTVCGTHDLFCLIENVPAAWSENSMINDILALHNNFMDIFRTTASDGTYGNNSSNEFGGYASDTTLTGIYGSYSWGGSLAVTFTYRPVTPACAQISQSDVFWNPAYSFSDDPAVWFNSSNIYPLRTTTIHEIGHIWGYQTGDAEQYNYDDPSIMHAISKDIWELGRGLHAKDAIVFRNAYSPQTSLKTINDIGVEAYYTDEGMIPSAFSPTPVTAGDNIDILNVTEENMSPDVKPIRLRFYLSDQTDFNGTYYQIGQTWNFSTFPAHSWSINSYTNQNIPLNVPPGTYYLLVYVDENGATDDNASNNTAVFSQKLTVNAPPPNILSWSPAFFSRNIIVGQNASNDTFDVWNSGNSISMAYSISDDVNWLNVTSSFGSSSGPHQEHTINYATSGLTPGSYNGTITINAAGAQGSPGTIQMTMNVANPSDVNDWSIY